MVHLHEITNLASTIPEVLRVIVTGVDPHPTGVDPRQRFLVVIYELFRSRVDKPEAGRFVDRNHLVIVAGVYLHNMNIHEYSLF